MKDGSPFYLYQVTFHLYQASPFNICQVRFRAKSSFFRHNQQHPADLISLARALILPIQGSFLALRDSTPLSPLTGTRPGVCARLCNVANGSGAPSPQTAAMRRLDDKRKWNAQS